MQRQACEPCAKRKVRCDRTEPCSNCKRRKQDHCSYPELTPGDRIKQLEALVKWLGGNPDDIAAANGASYASTPASSTSRNQSLHQDKVQASPADSSSKDPFILEEEDGEQHYLESRVWLAHGHRESGNRAAHARNPLLLRSAPHALSGIIHSSQTSILTVTKLLYESKQTIWKAFRRRVQPMTKILFDWDLDRYQSTISLVSDVSQLDDAQAALLSSICLAGINSLSNAECQRELERSRVSLLAESQSVCEAALAKTSILCLKNVMSLKAMTIYIMVSLERLSTQSLWTLLGLAIRNGEKLGIHRDGTILGLSPFETEDRRRLWWLLQYLDLLLAVRLGATSLTLTADWDVEMPLNVEDSDMSPDMHSFPENRRGLTSISYCQFTYYVLDQQRRYHVDKGRFELSWSSNQSVPKETKTNFIDDLEEGLNKRFVQYCDPIKPLHLLLQMMARALICVFRQRVLFTTGNNGNNVEHAQRGPLLASSMTLLEYAVAMHSHPLLEDFQWWTAGGFPWPAFMVVLIEASHETEVEKCQRIWTLLADLFQANASLFDLDRDRRHLHAAELIVAAWRTCSSKGTVGPSSTKPAFVVTLENLLAKAKANSASALNQPAVRETESEPHVGSEVTQDFSVEFNVNDSFDFDLQDIDWSFWNSID